MKTTKVITIAGSGDVEINELELAIINTKEFQRLRRIKKLGPVSLVFPSAVHTLLDHSLGTLQRTNQIIKVLSSHQQPLIPNDLFAVARLFALLSQMFELPFNLSTEITFTRDRQLEALDNKLNKKSEIATIIQDYLGAETFDRLLMILKFSFTQDEQLNRDYLAYDLIANKIGAKACDTWKRDSLFCGLNLNFEYRFLDKLTIYADRSGKMRLAVEIGTADKIRYDVVSELIGNNQASSYLDECVYSHRKVIPYRALLTSIIYRALDKKTFSFFDLYSMGDEELLYRLHLGGDKSIVSLIESFQHGGRWNILCRPDNRSTTIANKVTDYPERCAIERQLATALELNDDEFILYTSKTKEDAEIFKEVMVKKGSDFMSLHEFMLTQDKMLPVIDTRTNIGQENLGKIIGFTSAKVSRKSTDLIKDIDRYFGTLDESTASPLNSATIYFKVNLDGKIDVFIRYEDGTHQFSDGTSLLINKLYILSHSKWSQILSQLERLINNRNTTESELQKFLEAHPELLTGKDYVAVIPQAYINRVGNKNRVWRADFILAPYTPLQNSKIVEIKVPNFATYKTTKSGHFNFSSNLMSAINQVRDYGESFEANETRREFKQTYGYDIYKPDLHIIAGRTHEKQLELIDDIKNERKKYPVIIEDWDSVLARLSRNFSS